MINGNYCLCRIIKELNQKKVKNQLKESKQKENINLSQFVFSRKI